MSVWKKSLTASTFSDHEPGCFRKWLARVKEDGTVTVMPSLGGRWSCPQCTNYKIDRKLRRLVKVEEMVSVGWISNRSALQKASERKDVGYLTVTLQGRRGYLVIANAKLGRTLDGEDMPVDEAVRWLGKQIEGDVVKRFSLSNHWRVTPQATQDVIIPAHEKKTYEEVRQGIVEAGYPEFKFEGDVREVVAKIGTEIKNVWDEELGLFNTA